MNERVEPAAGRDGSSPTRRALLAAVAAGGVGCALGGCSTYGEQDSTSSSGGQSGSTSSNASGGTGSGAGGAAIAQVSDVPVGGGVVLADRKVVVTQPSKGTVKAFSAVCTHTGCTVSGVSGGVITCPCHGSTFRVADGSVANGPAAQPLPTVGVTVDGDDIKLT